MNNLKTYPLFITVPALMVLFTSGLFTASARASATADPISVDVRVIPFPRVVSPADLRYSPYWQSTVEGSGRSVRIDVVTDPDTASAVTNTLTTSGVGLESNYAWTPASAAQPYRRLLHWTLDGGAPTGMPLVCDVVISKVSLAGTACDVDARTNSLQEVADVDGIADLAYSPIWTFGGNTVQIKRIVEREDPASTTTNLLFQSGSLFESEYALAIVTVPSSYCVLQHITLDADNQPIGDVLTAEFVIDRPDGSIIILR